MKTPALTLALAVALASASLLGSGCATARFVPDEANGFRARTDADHKHYVYLPADWTPEKSWPVIIYLHGGGELGSDGIPPTQVGLGPVVWNSHGKFPFIVIFPQCARGHFWAYPDMDARVLASLEGVLRDFHGDPDRVYLTGNSMGGFGTWLIGARHPNVFAALAPMAGGVRPPAGVRIPKDSVIANEKDPDAAVARKIGKTPVWAFHGAKDWLVNPINSRRLVAAMQAAGGTVKYSEIPGVGHNVEDTAYLDPALFEWFAAQKRVPAEAGSP